MPAAVLISQTDPPPGREEEFERWYEDQHVPGRLELSGMTAATRARAVQGGPAHVAIYHASGPDVFRSDEYRRLKSEPSALTADMLRSVAAFTRFVGTEIADSGHCDLPRYLYLVTCAVPPAAQAGFDEWYAEDHVPRLLRNPGWRRCRRYAIDDSEPAGVTRAALHEIDSVAVLDSPERADARASRWRARLAAEPWFATMRYAVYERIADRVA